MQAKKDKALMQNINYFTKGSHILKIKSWIIDYETAYAKLNDASKQLIAKNIVIFQQFITSQNKNINTLLATLDWLRSSDLTDAHIEQITQAIQTIKDNGIPQFNGATITAKNICVTGSILFYLVACLQIEKFNRATITDDAYFGRDKPEQDYEGQKLLSCFTFGDLSFKNIKFEKNINFGYGNTFKNCNFSGISCDGTINLYEVTFENCDFSGIPTLTLELPNSKDIEQLGDYKYVISLFNTIKGIEDTNPQLAENLNKQITTTYNSITDKIIQWL